MVLRGSVILCCLLLIQAGVLQAQDCVEYAAAPPQATIPGLTNTQGLAWSDDLLFSYHDSPSGWVLEVGEFSADRVYHTLDSVPTELANSPLVTFADLCAVSLDFYRFRLYRYTDEEGLVEVFEYESSRGISAKSMSAGGVVLSAGTYETSYVNVWPFAPGKIGEPVEYALPGRVTHAVLDGDLLYCGHNRLYGPSSIVIYRLDGEGTALELGRLELWNVNDGYYWTTGRVTFLEQRGGRLLMDVVLSGYGGHDSIGATRLFSLDVSDPASPLLLDTYRLFDCWGEQCGPISTGISWAGDTVVTGNGSASMLHLDGSGSLQFVTFLPVYTSLIAAGSSGLILGTNHDHAHTGVWDFGYPPRMPMKELMSLGRWFETVRPMHAVGDTVVLANDIYYANKFTIQILQDVGDDVLQIALVDSVMTKPQDLHLSEGSVYSAFDTGVFSWSLADGNRTGPWVETMQARQVVREDGRIYAATAPGDLVVCSDQAPGAPPLGSVPVGDVADMLLRGEVLFLAGDGLQILDVGDPSSLQPTVLEFGASFQHLESVADRLYAATEDAVVIYRVGDPQQPVEVARIEVRGILDIAAREDRLVVLTETGQELYDLSRVDLPRHLGGYFWPYRAPMVPTKHGFLLAGYYKLMKMLPDCDSSVANDEQSPPSASDLGARLLLPPRPNPFNPRTELTYALPLPGPVELTIHDPAGRLLRALVAAPRFAGRHTAVWDGRDARGRGLPAGVYFARLRAGDHVESRKLMLLN